MDDVIGSIAVQIATAVPLGRFVVAIDGVDGSGKTTFAARLAACVEDRPVIVLHADNFLNPSSIRNARGRWSSEGHWRDLYDYAAFLSTALMPLRSGGDGWFRSASYDFETDATVFPDPVLAPENAIVLVEGLFLHRDELADLWDLSVFLDVPFEEMALRLAKRDGTHPDPNHVTTRRYVGGQRLYFEQAQPWNRANIVVDNSDVGEPRIVRRSSPIASPRPTRV